MKKLTAHTVPILLGTVVFAVISTSVSMFSLFSIKYSDAEFVTPQILLEGVLAIVILIMGLSSIGLGFYFDYLIRVKKLKRQSLYMFRETVPKINSELSMIWVFTSDDEMAWYVIENAYGGTKEEWELAEMWKGDVTSEICTGVVNISHGDS